MSELLFHKTVLLQEVLEYLDPKPGKIYVDVTFGSGGHTRGILEREKKCSVIAVDWDKISLETYKEAFEEQYGDRVTFLWGNFAHLYKLLKKEKVTKVDGILADFGTSQMQILEREGFSFSRETRLDMRMSHSHYTVTAERIVNEASAEELAEIFWRYGQEAKARTIAKKIVEERKKKRIRTTRDLALIIESIISPKGRRVHPATKVFQALRICVNKELENIHSFLQIAPSFLNKGGRLACISFHSLEDRMVKQAFQEGEQKGILKIITKHMISPSDEEIRANPSARSACLRVAERI